MLRTRVQLFSICALLTVAGVVLADDSSDQTLNEIAGYREWTRVNEKTVMMLAAPLSQSLFD